MGIPYNEGDAKPGTLNPKLALCRLWATGEDLNLLAFHVA